MLYCGLSEGLATRFMQYLAVLPVRVTRDGSSFRIQPHRVTDCAEPAQPTHAFEADSITCRLVMLQYSYNSRRGPVEKHNILTEAIDLVRRRKTVSEKLYFHKTKLAATSMLSAAAHASGICHAAEIWDKSDREVLRQMVAVPEGGLAGGEGGKDKFPPLEERRRLRAKRLAEKLLARGLFKPVYRVSCPKDSSPTGNAIWGEAATAYERLNSAEKREQLIEMLEFAVGLATTGSPTDGIGAVSVSCPDSRMQLKEFNMLVLESPRAAMVGRLQDSLRPAVKAEVEVIQRGHVELWCLEVFLDAHVISLDNDVAGELACAVQHDIGPRNEVAEFAGQPKEGVKALAARLLLSAVLREEGMSEEDEKQMRLREHGQLVECAREACFRPNAKELVRRRLHELLKPGPRAGQTIEAAAWPIVEPYATAYSARSKARIRGRLRTLDAVARRDKWSPERIDDLISRFKERAVEIPSGAYVLNRVAELETAVLRLAGQEEDAG